MVKMQHSADIGKTTIAL